MEISFAVAGHAGRVDPHHPLWNQTLPMRTGPGAADQGQTAAVTHAAYFKAVQTYLRTKGVRHLLAALDEDVAKGTPSPLPDRIEVILEKHGAFYHPARILTPTLPNARPFVLNVAATPAGIQWMGQELEALEQVAPRLPAGSIPQVHGTGTVADDSGGCFRMFLADWFADYHEFHLSMDQHDGQQKIVVWDSREGPYYLPTELAQAVYYQAAYLLARAYDHRTTCQIYPWHHASGDFVLCRTENGIHLKLISVRQYAPTLAAETGRQLDDDSLQMAFIVFFANLSLRNRIDRLDGTGDLAWAGDAAVAPTVAGCRQALVDAGEGDALLRTIEGFQANDWIELLTAVGRQYLLMPAESALLECSTAAHAASLADAIHQELRK